MHMGIDHAGHQRGVTQIDDLGACGVFHARSDGANAIAFDKNFAGLQDRTGVDLEQPRSVQHDRTFCCGRLLRGGRSVEQKHETGHDGEEGQLKSSNRIEGGHCY